jgi:hypothetical protein
LLEFFVLLFSSSNMPRNDILQLAKKYEINDLVCLIQPTTGLLRNKNQLSNDFSSLLYYVIDNKTPQLQSNNDTHRDTEHKNTQKEKQLFLAIILRLEWRKRIMTPSQFLITLNVKMVLEIVLQILIFSVEGKLIPAHKVILCATSEYFKYETILCHSTYIYINLFCCSCCRELDSRFDYLCFRNFEIELCSLEE